MSVWYTAPTAIRMLMKAGAELAEAISLPQAALRRERRRAAQSRGRVVGRGGVRSADPRQLVADGNRRHHDREHAGDGHQAGLDGQAAARRRGVRRAAPRRWLVRGDPCAGCRRRTRAARRLAVDVPRLPAPGRALPEVLQRRSLPDRRSRQARRRRLFLVRRPRRRRDQVGRASDRAVRGRERADGASGGGRGRRHRQARSDRRRNSEGVRFAEDGIRAQRRLSDWSSSATRASASARRWRRRRSRSSRRCRARAAARSCGAC